MSSIRSRLLMWLMVPLALVAAAVSVETFLSAQRLSHDLHDRTLLAAMLAISENVVASNGTLLADETLDVLTDNLGDQYFYHVAGPANAFVTGYSGFPRLPAGEELIDGQPVFYDGVHLGNDVRVIALRQLLVGRELNGLTTITAWQQVTQRDRMTLEIFSRSLIRLALLVLSAGAIVWFAVAFGMRPMRDLRRAIDSRSPYDLTPIKRPMPTELSGIVNSMNDLFARVARSKSNRERFIGDAAHQLKNPIAALKVQAETSLTTNKLPDAHSGLQRILDTVNQTGRMVSQMLTSARLNALDSASLEPFDPADVVTEATRSLASRALDKGQEIALDIDGRLPEIVGHRLLLQEAVINLIDNAISHTEPGGEITVSLHQFDDPTVLRIGVADTGDMITQAEFQNLSQPFATGGGPTAGSGLGLSVAKEVARSHGGDLVLIQNPQHGKTIAIELPIARQDNQPRN